MKNINSRLMKCAAISCVAVYACMATEPNYVETIVHQDETDTKPALKAREYSDGLGRAIQSQSLINNSSLPDSVIISAAQFDDAGRPWKAAKAFPMAGGLEYKAANIIESANLYYNGVKGPDADGFAYSETNYWPDPLGRAKKSGAPGDDFRIGGGHENWVWNFGTYQLNASDDHLDNSGFLNQDGITALLASITSDDGNYQPDYSSEYVLTHFLTVTKGANSNSISQEIRDIFGNVIRTWSEVNPSYIGEEIIASYEYDILGNVLTEIPPAAEGGTALISPTTYQYNTLGQLMNKTTPDAGTTLYKYDSGGRLRYVQTANLALNLGYLIYDYDKFGRVVHIGEVTGISDFSYSFPAMDADVSVEWSVLFNEGEENNGGPNATYSTKARKFYDKIPTTMFSDFKVDLGPATQSEIFSATAQNSKGRLVCEIAYQVESSKRVADIFAYDDEGRLATKWKSITGFQEQKFTYSYDLQGRLIEQKWYSGKQQPVTTTYAFDDNGRLTSVRDSRKAGVDLVKYDYATTGLLAYKQFESNSLQKSLPTCISYNYTISDWLKTINTAPDLTIGNAKFSELIGYNENASGITPAYGHQYNGNISVAKFMYPGKWIAYHYNYDKANRLNELKVNENEFNEFNGWPVANNQEDFIYDQAGRFLAKSKGSFMNEPTVPADKIYNYYRNPGDQAISNRLKNVGAGDVRNYAYDANGNMIIDRAKNMVIVYDWRDMPVLFSFYPSATINAILDNSANFNATGTLTADLPTLLESSGMVSQVVMYYDASGSRVVKSERVP